jgi:hypothetical protein
MAPIDWTGVLARERIADLRRAAERERLARLARAGGGRIRRGRPVAGQHYRARALIAWLWQRLRQVRPRACGREASSRERPTTARRSIRSGSGVLDPCCRSHGPSYQPVLGHTSSRGLVRFPDVRPAR